MSLFLINNINVLFAAESLKAVIPRLYVEASVWRGTEYYCRSMPTILMSFQRNPSSISGSAQLLFQYHLLNPMLIKQ